MVQVGAAQLMRPSRMLVLGTAAVVLSVLLAVAGTAGPARAANISVNLDQFATKNGWQNGDLNGNNTSYPEGGVVPFRLAIEGLKKGSHSIIISYDFTAGGHKAYDFLATWNAWRAPNLCGAGGGAVSSHCPSLGGASTFSFPSDGYKADGLTVAGAQAWSGVSRRMTIYGGTITSISGPRHSGSASANSDAEITVRFTSRGSWVLMSWGGHLAQSSYWNRSAGGVPDGAGQVSGAPWHMRTLGLDGGGARNQDRSIQSSAISGALPPPATPTPRPPAPQPTAPPPTPRPQQPAAPTPAPVGGVTGPTAAPTLTLPPTATIPGAEIGGQGFVGAVVLILLAVSAVLFESRRLARRRLDLRG